MCHSYSFNSKKLRNEKYVNEIYAHLCSRIHKTSFRIGIYKRKRYRTCKKGIKPIQRNVYISVTAPYSNIIKKTKFIL